MKEKYAFRDCTLSIMDDLFGLRKTFTSPVLNSWLQMTPTISEKEKGVLEIFQELFIVNSDAWNEQELSLHFIGPIFGLVHFTIPYQFNLFAERHIGALVPTVEGDIGLGGEPDGIIATGYREPKIPMFAFFSEYKRELSSSGDPVGQTLAAMLVGQVLNKQPIPIYGCYVIGHDWHFLTLENKNYTISRGFSAVTDDILDIFRILKALKMIIMDLTAPDDTASDDIG